MSAGIYNIHIEQGATYTLLLTITQSDGVTPLPLTGYTGKAYLKKSYVTKDPPVKFTIDIYAPLDGKLSMSLSPAITTDLVAAGNLLEAKPQYVYDIKITSPEGKVSRLLKGSAYVSPEVTRDVV